MDLLKGFREMLRMWKFPGFSSQVFGAYFGLAAAGSLAPAGKDTALQREDFEQ